VHLVERAVSHTDLTFSIAAVESDPVFPRLAVLETDTIDVHFQPKLLLDHLEPNGIVLLTDGLFFIWGPPGALF
jgi:hypothetical protein